MKQTYQKPHTAVIILRCKTQMLSQSYDVNEYNRGQNITVGDED